MRLRCRDIKKIALMCAGIIFLITVHVASVYVFAVHRFTVSYDPLVSEKAQQKIEDFIQLSKLYASPCPLKVAEQLQKQFPFIRRVTCSYTPSGLHLYLKTYRPCIKLEHDELVTANNYRVPADYFIPGAVLGLPVLHSLLEPVDRLPEDMFAYITSVDPELFKGATIQWRHANEIVCLLSGQPMSLICNSRMKPTHEIVRRCLVIAHDLKERPISAQAFSADVRFTDRIVVAKIRNEGVRA